MLYLKHIFFVYFVVKHLSGLCRLQFTRKPYSHWSISFIGDPKIDMDIKTLFQGRTLQPSLTGLLSHQIRKAIRRKHTLPIFKIRYKPFFQKLVQEFDVAEMEPSGRLDVNISELSRLKLPNTMNYVFCTLTLSPYAWVQARQVSDNKLVITIDVTIHRAKNQQIGIIFRQLKTSVVVDNIIPNTPATLANVLPDDVLLYIENKKVNNVTQIHKIIKAMAKKEVTLRLERLVGGAIWNDNGCDDIGAYEDMDDFSNISFSKAAESVQIGKKTQSPQKDSQEKVPSTDSSNKSLPNTPSHSPNKKSPLRFKESQDRQVSSTLLRKHSGTEVPSVVSISSQRSLTVHSSASSIYESDKGDDKEELVDELVIPAPTSSVIEEKLQQHTTIDVLAKATVQINDLTHFELTKDTQWLNLCVYGRCNKEVQLLGYANIAVSNIIIECGESNLWQIIRRFTLRPPTPPDL